MADCVIETDLELLLPMDYVSQESERIALYQELDSIERDDELEAFEKRLEDRFGRIPESARELLRVPMLRRLARRLGIEKVAIKQNTMYTYFVGDSSHPYYQSAMFGKMVAYLTSHMTAGRPNKRNDRCSFIFSNVGSISRAIQILTDALNTPV